LSIGLALSISLALLTQPAAGAPSPASGDLAKQLVSALSSTGLDAIAARDPEAPGRVVAALAFPGSQLLVVAAPYADGATVDAWLANRMYRDVYSALQQPSITTGKVFFQDLGCDGLQPAGGSVDVMYENGKTQTIFDGDWKKQKLSQAAYQERAKAADERYARLLRALLSAAQKPGL
jgi:hypothetical protein